MTASTSRQRSACSAAQSAALALSARTTHNRFCQKPLRLECRAKVVHTVAPPPPRTPRAGPLLAPVRATPAAIRAGPPWVAIPRSRPHGPATAWQLGIEQRVSRGLRWLRARTQCVRMPDTGHGRRQVERNPQMGAWCRHGGTGASENENTVNITSILNRGPKLATGFWAVGPSCLRPTKQSATMAPARQQQVNARPGPAARRPSMTMPGAPAHWHRQACRPQLVLS